MIGDHDASPDDDTSMLKLRRRDQVTVTRKQPDDAAPAHRAPWAWVMFEQTQETPESQQALHDDVNTELATAVAKVQQLFRHRQDLADHPSTSLDEARAHRAQCTDLLQHLELARQRLE